MSIKKKRIALFGGSFDPVHTDHVNIAKACHEQLNFDEVWFIPTYLNPFKEMTNSSPADRLAMLELATKDYEWIKINEFEISQATPSYTFQTVTHFLSDPEFSEFEFAFIMGSDQLDQFEQWDQFDDLIKAIKFKVFKRSDDYNRAVVNKYQLEVFDFNRIGLSSTMIRNLEHLDQQIKVVNDYTNNHLLYLNERLKNQMDDDRYEHCLNVGQKAAELAKIHGFDVQKALVAGTLHDVTKRWAKQKSQAYLEKYGPELIAEPDAIWHSFVGAFHLKYDWLIDDEDILNAVFNHTVGRPKMSALEKIIFCADKVSVERTYEEVSELRNLVEQNLDSGFKAVLQHIYEWNKQEAARKDGLRSDTGQMIEATYNYYIVEGNN